MTMNTINALSATAVDASQIADIVSDEGVETLFQLDNGSATAFVLHGQHRGDFIIIQSTGTGDGFVVQLAGSPEESVHAHARHVLSAAFGK